MERYAFPLVDGTDCQRAESSGGARAAAAGAHGAFMVAVWRPTVSCEAPSFPHRAKQGVEEYEASPALPCWSWARLLQRVFALDMATCPFFQRGTLRVHCGHEVFPDPILRGLSSAAGTAAAPLPQPSNGRFLYA